MIRHCKISPMSSLTRGAILLSFFFLGLIHQRLWLFCVFLSNWLWLEGHSSDWFLSFDPDYWLSCCFLQECDTMSHSPVSPLIRSDSLQMMYHNESIRSRTVLAIFLWMSFTPSMREVWFCIPSYYCGDLFPRNADPYSSTLFLLLSIQVHKAIGVIYKKENNCGHQRISFHEKSSKKVMNSLWTQEVSCCEFLPLF